jgi:hypothetical protein
MTFSPRRSTRVVTGQVLRHVAVLGFALVSAVWCALGAEPAARVAFDIPADNAVASLRRFAKQAEVQVIFIEDAIDGIRTNAVKGELPVAVALERMLDGTGLKMARDDSSGAFAVSRAPREAEFPKTVGAARAVTRRSQMK